MHYFYRSNGRLERVAESADKEGTGKGYAQTGYEYDANGNLTKITTPSGNEILRTYDADNFLIKEEHREPGGDIENTFTYAYDKAGNLVKVTDNLAGWMLEKREPAEVKVREEKSEVLSTDGSIHASGKKREVSYRLTTYEYDKNGNLTKEKRFLEHQSETSRNGKIHVISYEYDKINRITKVTDTTGAELRYTYNSRNALTSLKEKMAEGKWREMHYFYRSNGRLERMAESADKEGTGKGYAQTGYEYDASGNLTKITTPSGDEILRTYDADNFLIKEEHREPGGDIENTFTYASATSMMK